MKLQLSPLASDIFIAIYAVLTLALRFYFESQAAVTAGFSIAIGACFVLIIWVLIKAKFLQPNWFGLFKKSAK